MTQSPVSTVSLLVPPHMIKKKAGDGGIEPSLIQQAQAQIENNKVEFPDIAAPLISLIDQAITQAEAGMLKRHEAIEAIIYPAMQLKAQGSMFGYPLMTNICNTLIDFLDTLEGTDKETIKIIILHQQSIRLILNKKIKGEGGADGQTLHKALQDACGSYSRKNNLKS